MENEVKHDEHDHDETNDTGFDETGLKNVLSGLEAEDAENGDDFDPDANPYQSEEDKEREAEKKAAIERKRHEQAVETVVQALGMYESGIQMGLHGRFVLDESEKLRLAQNFAPAVVKHLPEGFDFRAALFGQYMPEVMAIIGVYMLGKSTIASVKELRQQDKDEKAAAEREKRQRRASANEPEPEPIAA